MDLTLGDTRRILAECDRHGLTIPQKAYVLATARWETAHTMKPVRETLADTDASAIAQLRNRARGRAGHDERPRVAGSCDGGHGT